MYTDKSNTHISGWYRVNFLQRVCSFFILRLTMLNGFYTSFFVKIVQNATCLQNSKFSFLLKWHYIFLVRPCAVHTVLPSYNNQGILQITILKTISKKLHAIFSWLIYITFSTLTNG